MTLLNRNFTFFLGILLSFQLCAQPVVSSFSPASGPVGSSVTITGSNFSATPANNIVFFGAVKATVTAASANALTVIAPSGATYQPLTVTVNGLTANSQLPFLVTFPNGGEINSNSFDIRQDVPTDIRPNAVVLADLDGDGKADIATPNDYITANLASVSVIRNTSAPGTTSFAPKQDLQTDAVTYGIAAGDIDGDGKPDLVATSAMFSKIELFRNTSSPGTISFAPRMDITSAAGTFALALADIDGDGRPDLLVVGTTSQSITILRNTSSPGSISFAPEISFLTQLSPQGISVGDFDADGKTDIACTNNLSNSLSLFRNSSTPGSIVLAARVDIAMASAPHGISTGDLDGDSKPDLVVVAKSTSSDLGALLYRNKSTVGTLSFSVTNTLPTGSASNKCFYAAITD